MKSEYDRLLRINEETIDEETTKMNTEKVEEYIKEVQTEDGTMSQLKFWKLKQKLVPQEIDPPMAKIDDKGNIVTTAIGLKNEYLKTYKKRLSHEIRHTRYREI